MSKTRVICFANNKGGSGKSTTCSNIGYFMADAGKKSFIDRRRYAVEPFACLF